MALAAPLTWALAVILFRRSGETLPAFELNFVKNLVAFALMAPTLLIWGGSLPAFTRDETIVILLSGVLGMAAGDILYFRAINLMGASLSGIVASLLSPFVILLSALYLGERLAGLQWAGFALVMAGILLVTWRRRGRERDSGDIRKGAVIGATGIFLMAVGVVMVKPILESHSFAWVVGVRLAGGIFGMVLFASLGRRWVRGWRTVRQPHPWGMTLLASFLGGYLAMLLWLGGYTLIPASEASVYNEAQGAFIVLFAWLFLGEPLGVKKLLGVALTLTGVIVMLIA